MSVLLAPLREGLGAGVLGLGTEQPGLLPVPGDALAPEVAKVGCKRRGRYDGPTRVFTVTRRERPVSRWLARTLAVRPRPEGRAPVRPARVPGRETPPAR